MKRFWWIVVTVSLTIVVLGAIGVALWSIITTQQEIEKSTIADVDYNWICAGMLDPEVCNKTLRNAPGAATDSPKELATYLMGTVLAALNVSSLTVNQMLAIDSNASSNYLHSTGALKACNAVIQHAKNRLTVSLRELSGTGVTRGSKAKATRSDIQTWLSASMNFFDTCIDELLMAATSGYSTSSAEQRQDPVIANGAHVRQLHSILLRVTSYLDSTLSSSQMAVFPRMSGTGRGRSFVPVRQGLPPQASAEHFSHHMKRLLLDISTRPPNATVDPSKKSSGSVYQTIQEAVNAAPTDLNSDERYVIKILEGVYDEQINVSMDHTRIAFVGAGIDKTVITGSLDYEEIGSTFGTATLGIVGIDGDGFLGTGFTVRNTAGPENEQAVALRVSADKVAFSNVKATAHQDTLLAHCQRQFYSQCYIEGSVDVIFGDSSAYFQDCDLVATTGLEGQQKVFTAQGRTDPNQNTGFVFQNCTLSPSAIYSTELGGVKSYLGRPWKNYSRTIFLDSYMDGIIAPEGWLSWVGAPPPDTLYYAEYRNRGPGSDTSQRVNWTGVHLLNDSQELAPFLPDAFISSSSWMPDTTFQYSNDEALESP